MAGLLLLGQKFNDGQIGELEFAAGALAGLAVGVPFFLSARTRRRRTSPAD